MPKHDRFSPKGIANRIKSKGLQKLRWYCQMCSKQCRDENGFKCHLMSESHQRQLLLFAEDSDTYMSEFSRDFEKGYLDILRFSFGGRRVKANEVYRDYIKHKEHVHMNSTQWHTLTTFVHYLGRTGKCTIDNTEKGWFVKYIDQEEELRKQKEMERVKNDVDDEERMLDFVQRQAERAKECGEPANHSAPTALIKTDDKKIEFALGGKRGTTADPGYAESTDRPSTSKTNVFDEAAEKVTKSDLKKLLQQEERKRKRGTGDDGGKPSKRSALDEIREMEERRKEARNRKDNWLHEDIVVKVVTKKLGDGYYKKKGVITSLVDDYTAMVRILDDKGDVLKLDQTHVETVIPALGRPVLVVNGAYRGKRATLEQLDERNYCVSVTIDEGAAKGRTIRAVAYEDVCKLAV